MDYKVSLTKVSLILQCKLIFRLYPHRKEPTFSCFMFANWFLCTIPHFLQFLNFLRRQKFSSDLKLPFIARTAAYDVFKIMWFEEHNFWSLNIWHLEVLTYDVLRLTALQSPDIPFRTNRLFVFKTSYMRLLNNW